MVVGFSEAAYLLSSGSTLVKVSDSHTYPISFQKDTCSYGTKHGHQILVLKRLLFAAFFILIRSVLTFSTILCFITAKSIFRQGFSIWLSV